jgi:hypothetical protein
MPVKLCAKRWNHNQRSFLTGGVMTQIENLLDSLRKREEAAWGMASMFLENRDAHGVMDAGSELESLRRAISELEKLNRGELK